MKFLSAILLVCFSFIGFSQSEQVVFIQSEQSQLKNEKKGSNFSLIELPFFDDFSYPYSQPLSQNWIDSYVFVNKSFGKNTFTIGVATFDALDDKGKLYSHVSSNPSIADYLTSQPINLESYKKYYPTDKLYIKNPSFQLLGNDYYIYYNQAFEPVAKGLLFAAGDTIYQKVGADYIPLIDSIYSQSFEYIQGSYAFETVWNNYLPTDSVALSFYYQSGGNADKPESIDSLVLEFSIPFDRQGVFINEITQTWVELYNATDTVVSIKNWFIVHDTISKIIQAQTLNSYSITQDLQIAPYSYGVVNANQLGISAFETTMCMLYNADTVLVDSIDIFEQITQDASYARIPDGNPQWSFSISQTCNYTNPSWQRIWGSSADTDEKFDSVYLRISPQMFSKGFRFRFKNYVSLSNDPSHARNEDFWNIDMVWLDSKRKPSVPNPSDVAFVKNISPLYNAYSAIPLSHFSAVQSSNFRLTIDASFNNFDSVYRKVKFGFEVEKLHTDEVLSYQTYETDIPAYALANERDVLTDWNVDFVDFMKQDIGLFDQTEYEYRYFYTDNANSMYEQYRWNDTNRVSFTMANYYAYDDGIPEAGYGLREAPMGRVAYKFSILSPDTLKAVNMYFNPTLLSSPPIFNLCVWAADNNGLPGELLYKQPGEIVKFVDGMFTFVTYPITNEGILTGEKSGMYITNDFFVGWEQPYDVLLNVGLDVTSSLKNKIYYNTGFEWLASSQNGALLIRPVFGKLLPTQAIDEVFVDNTIILYPTVVSHNLYIDIQNTNVSITSVTIKSMFGQQVHSQIGNQSEVYLPNLPNGIYICEVVCSNNEIISKNFIVRK
ncbi:MAG: hypothetical protein BWY22_00479 [Bacteroidetes bacterium ADurb.Bin217]|nr:MAG: hypothetical protein BWY22_00479 [Bacteroidetes bacterium ADurb.Bin217]